MNTTTNTSTQKRGTKNRIWLATYTLIVITSGLALGAFIANTLVNLINH